MSTIIAIDESQSKGMIRKINGGCLAPPISSENAGRSIRGEFAALRLPITRLHDAPLDNAGLSLVDVPMIFPLFHADVDDPLNYNFRATDDYLANCLSCGTKIYYRLGISIDHSINKYVADPPTDIDKWIDIVSHIIRHYNDGWADGFYYNIEYWEIWNEAEGLSRGAHTMWNAPVETYYEFYVKAARELKRRFPYLKIGGPSNCQWVPDNGREYGKEFIDFCLAHDAPLDFYGFHVYANAPNWVTDMIYDVRAYLDLRGLYLTELHLTEWSYIPHNGFYLMREDRRNAGDIYARMKGLQAAAFISHCLAAWQDAPLDLGCYYTVSTLSFGLFQPFSHLPAKNYYGLKAFGELAFFYPERIAVTMENPPPTGLPSESGNQEYGFSAIGGRDEAGNVAVLVSNYRCGKRQVVLRLSHPEQFRRIEILLLDETHDLSPALKLDSSPAEIVISSPSDSAVFLLKAWNE